MEILFSTEGGELSKTFSARSLIIFEGGFPGPGVLSGQHKAWHMPGALQIFVEWSTEETYFDSPGESGPILYM